MNLRALPQVDELARESGLSERLGHALAVSLAREAVGAARSRARDGDEIDAETVVADTLGRAASLERMLLRGAINATGVVLHTNLGRAPLAEEAVAAMREAAGATALEFDVASGERGARAPGAARLVCALTGAQAAHVVNNNAGALVLALAAIARGGEVIVSRGELIEIGGEFRLPAIMEASGASLVEVGTTNRTRASDVRAAIGERTALVLKVHPSNFRIVGFTAEPSLSDVAAIAHEAGLPVLYDTGSGLLQPDAAWPDEPDATTALRDGADLVCFSGDKLLGGPQSGILCGRADLVEACKRHPLARALRADKTTLAALEATLLLHARGAYERIPVRRMMATTTDELRPRAQRIAGATGASVLDGESVVGGGSVPGRSVPSVLVAVTTPHPEAFAAALRAGDPPVIARIQDGMVVLDVRTIDTVHDDTVIAALRAAA